jgi:formate dehydrogenase subunit gamma
MIKRHTPIDITMHWFNAVCWLFLLGTGLGLLRNESLQLFGGVWGRWMRGIFGTGETLLLAHEVVGIVWAAGFLLYGIFRFRQAVWPFTREIFTFSPARDSQWLFKKGILMTLGPGALRKRGIDPALPDQGFYNAGQKMFAIPALLGGILIAVSGVVMVLSRVALTDTTWVQWAILIHFLGAGLVSAGLLIHIYMASLAPGERPAFVSMFTGYVPEDFARHHNRLWYETFRKTPAGEQATDEEELP